MCLHSFYDVKQAFGTILSISNVKRTTEGITEQQKNKLSLVLITRSCSQSTWYANWCYNKAGKPAMFKTQILMNLNLANELRTITTTSRGDLVENRTNI